jgi:hypothetical protein
VLTLHADDNYLRIAEFLENARQMSATHTGGPPARPRM